MIFNSIDYYYEIDLVEAIKEAVDNNAIVTFISDKSNEKLREQINQIDLKGCEVVKSHKESPIVVVETKEIFDYIMN